MAASRVGAAAGMCYTLRKANKSRRNMVVAA